MKAISHTSLTNNIIVTNIIFFIPPNIYIPTVKTYALKTCLLFICIQNYDNVYCLDFFIYEFKRQKKFLILITQ